MTRFTDPAYLREKQYKTPSNLTARADLHQRFSTAPGSWQGWVMDQLAAGIRPRLENAPEWMGPAFSRIEVVRRPDSLWVTEARPLVDYAYSMSSSVDGLARHRAGELENYFQARIQAQGGIHISKAGGMVLAWAD